MKPGFAYNLIQEIFSRAYSLATGNDPYPLRTILQSELRRTTPKRRLDVGCGSGCYAIPNFDYTGIDPNPKYIDYCRRNRPGNFEQMCGDKLEFADKTFGAVICFSVGHHLSDGSLTNVLAEIKRVLRDDGIFYFADVIRPITRSKVASKLLERWDEGDCFRAEEEYLELISLRFKICEQRELVDQFYRTGFFVCRKL
jgi:SAM-dependent methyltransferase